MVSRRFDGYLRPSGLCGCDHLTGVMVAVLENEGIQRTVLRGSLRRLIFTLVGIGHIIDFYILEKAVPSERRYFLYLANEGLVFWKMPPYRVAGPEKLKYFTRTGEEN